MADPQNDQDDEVFSFFTAPYDSTFTAAATPSTLFNRSGYSSSSSSGDEDSQPSIDDSNKRIDYMIQFLDRRLSQDGNFDGIGPENGSDSLPEFVGKCGETGIFKVPIRSAVHPNRPPSLEVRPHPLRETQIGRFLRTMTSTERQLWAGGEDGALRVWEFSELYGSGRGLEVEDTAPYKETIGNEIGSSVVCIIGDEGSRVVWSGHRDGRIRCWKFRGDHGIEEALSWQAHRGPVLSIAISAYGTLGHPSAVSRSSIRPPLDHPPITHTQHVHHPFITHRSIIRTSTNRSSVRTQLDHPYVHGTFITCLPFVPHSSTTNYPRLSSNQIAPIMPIIRVMEQQCDSSSEDESWDEYDDYYDSESVEESPELEPPDRIRHSTLPIRPSTKSWSNIDESNRNDLRLYRDFAGSHESKEQLEWSQFPLPSVPRSSTAYSLPKQPSRKISSSKGATDHSSPSYEAPMTKLVASPPPATKDIIAAMKANLQLLGEMITRGKSLPRQAESQVRQPFHGLDYDDTSRKRIIPPTSHRELPTRFREPPQPIEAELPKDDDPPTDQGILTVIKQSVRSSDFSFGIHRVIDPIMETERTRIHFAQGQVSLGHEPSSGTTDLSLPRSISVSTRASPTTPEIHSVIRYSKCFDRRRSGANRVFLEEDHGSLPGTERQGTISIIGQYRRAFGPYFNIYLETGYIINLGHARICDDRAPCGDSRVELHGYEHRRKRLTRDKPTRSFPSNFEFHQETTYSEGLGHSKTGADRTYSEFGARMLLSSVIGRFKLGKPQDQAGSRSFYSVLSLPANKKYKLQLGVAETVPTPFTHGAKVDVDQGHLATIFCNFGAIQNFIWHPGESLSTLGDYEGVLTGFPMSRTELDQSKLELSYKSFIRGRNELRKLPFEESARAFHLRVNIPSEISYLNYLGRGIAPLTRIYFQESRDMLLGDDPREGELTTSDYDRSFSPSFGFHQQSAYQGTSDRRRLSLDQAFYDVTRDMPRGSDPREEGHPKLGSTCAFSPSFGFHRQSAYDEVFDQGKMGHDRFNPRIDPRRSILHSTGRFNPRSFLGNWNRNFSLLGHVQTKLIRPLEAAIMLSSLVSIRPRPMTDPFDLTGEVLAFSLKALLFLFDPGNANLYPILDATDLFPFDPGIKVLRTKPLEEGGNDVAPSINTDHQPGDPHRFPRQAENQGSGSSMSNVQGREPALKPSSIRLGTIKRVNALSNRIKIKANDAKDYPNQEEAPRACNTFAPSRESSWLKMSFGKL